jgi:hypothetical protein
MFQDFGKIKILLLENADEPKFTIFLPLCTKKRPRENRRVMNASFFAFFWRKFRQLITPSFFAISFWKVQWNAALSEKKLSSFGAKREKRVAPSTP